MRGWLLTGALLMLLSVALGAFGAHGLKEQLTPDRLSTFQTGVHYHQLHALAMVIVGLASTAQPRPWRRRAAMLWVAGIVLFSGSLYSLAILGVAIMGAVAPIGGLAFMIGWLALAVDAVSDR